MGSKDEKQRMKADCSGGQSSPWAIAPGRKEQFQQKVTVKLSFCLIS
jgi:hypothetical protein